MGRGVGVSKFKSQSHREPEGEAALHRKEKRKMSLKILSLKHRVRAASAPTPRPAQPRTRHRRLRGGGQQLLPTVILAPHPALLFRPGEAPTLPPNFPACGADKHQQEPTEVVNTGLAPATGSLIFIMNPPGAPAPPRPSSTPPPAPHTPPHLYPLLNMTAGDAPSWREACSRTSSSPC